jgi:asparagine synthase (glutamine-hydrolysing)
MSAFVGVFSRSAQPITPDALQPMLDAVPWYGPDGVARWQQSQIGLAHLQRWNTSESCFEQQPLLHPNGQAVLVGVARLDNRADLIDRLHVPHTPATPATDADLILAAYTAWGDTCPRYLLGDFAFAIWDRAEQSLLLVRDQIGIVPCFFHLSPRYCIFATDLRAIVAHPAVSDRLNEAAIARHLCYAQYVMPGETFLAEIERLPPASLLRVTAERAVERTYWSPASVPSISLPDRAAYAERMAELLDQAVACRLRSRLPIGTHASGGLDSSAVAAIAQRRLAKCGATLTGYSWLPPLRPDDDPAAPEYVATRRVAELGIPVEQVDLTVEALLEEFERDISLDGFTDLWYEPLVRRQAASQGVGVMLSGYGGDELVSSSGQGYLAELFWQGRWGRLARTINARSRDAERPWRRRLGIFVREVGFVSLPQWLYQLWRQRRYPTLELYTGVAPAFVRRMRTQLGSALTTHTVGVHATQALRLTAGYLQDRIEAWAVQGARDGIEYRYPLLDRRLVEFCLGVPPELFRDGPTGRALFRAALAGILPDSIRLANVKLEQLRVNRYCEIANAACTDWLQRSGSPVGDPAPTADPAHRYLGRLSLPPERRAGDAQMQRIGRVLSLPRRIQVLVLTRNRLAHAGVA